MTRIIALSIATIALAWTAIEAAPVAAQDSSLVPGIPRNSQITTEYVQPRLLSHYDRLKSRQVLEELSQFLSPLKLKQPLKLTTAQCDTVNAFYHPGRRSITMCYEMVHHFHTVLAAFVDGKLHLDTQQPAYTLEATPNTIPLRPRVPGITRGEAAVGGFLSVMLHELGHAVFHIQEVPVLGREEDAADQVAALIMLQFGKDVARTTIKGAAANRDLASQVEARLGFPYYDEHSTSLQRLATLVCLAYGFDREAFQDLIDVGMIPASRSENCANEYREVADAFNTTVLPAIDKPLMEKVKAVKWLRPDELR